MTDELQGLIERIELATGPDRELDLLIMRWVENIGGPAENALRYTESVDAAKTLIPTPTEDGNYTFAVGDCHETEYDSWACVTEPPESSIDYWAHAVTPALALCAAALKARIIK